MLNLIFKIKKYYERFERFNPFVFFFGGFTWDSLTLKRIDQLFDNLILLLYLLLLGGLLVISALIEHNKIKHPVVLRHQKWVPLGLQFFLGGLFSAYVVFYFQSASLTKTALFLGILVVLLVANEFLEKKLRNIYLLLSLYFLASFSFFIFFVPVVLKMVNLFTFVSGGLLSLIMVLTVVWFFARKGVFQTKRSALTAGLLVFSLYLLMNVFYWQNWIPPVPLSLKSGGVYHHAAKSSADNTFVLKFEKPRWYEAWKRSDKHFKYAQGDTVSCFTAVFAPTKLEKKIIHHWQQYFPKRDKWLTTDKLGYTIIGYRDGGYRGITRKVNVSPGKWRVDVETDEGVLLGRINFNIEEVNSPVPLKTIYR
ncbi:MAG: DUF2914 domain-containing protein [bacterium]